MKYTFPMTTMWVLAIVVGTASLVLVLHSNSTMHSSTNNNNNEGTAVATVSRKLREFTNSGKGGVSISYTVHHPDPSLSVQLAFEGDHCSNRTAEFGYNDCHWDWGEKVTGSYTIVTPSTTISEAAFMSGTVIVSAVVVAAVVLIARECRAA